MQDARTTRTEAKAEAKAAKARAKALRPWYRKKRWYLAAGIVAVVGVAVAASSGSHQNGGGALASPAGVASLSSNSDFPPPADVSITGCSGPNSATIVTVTGSILNHSPKRSNYIIQGSVVDSTGTQVGTWFEADDNVGPGQSAKFQAVSPVTNPSGAVTCKVLSVDRMASEG